MLPVHQRLAELYTLSRRRELSTSEKAEQKQCLQVNATYCWEMARLQNETLLACLTNDDLWNQDISLQMLELRSTGKVAKHKE